MRTFYRIFIPITALAVVGSCGGDNIDVEPDKHNEDELIIVETRMLDSADAMNTSLNGRMFSIPSPIQMASLLRAKVGTFNENLLTDPDNVDSYVTEYKRALNMGIYGADLGYSTIYENNTRAVTYLSSIEKLSDDLGISGAFDRDLLERFIENGNEQDSMLVIMSEGYRKGDQYLKENEEHDIAVLVLTGGWIESLYFACVSFEETKDQEIANRIGEQKTALKTLIDLLQEFDKKEQGVYTPLITDLLDLQTVFNEVEFVYTYAEPIHDEANMVTTFTGKTFVKINNSILKQIISKIKSIRTNMIA